MALNNKLSIDDLYELREKLELILRFGYYAILILKYQTIITF